MKIDKKLILRIIKKYSPLSLDEIYKIFDIKKEKKRKVKNILKKLKSSGRIFVQNGLFYNQSSKQKISTQKAQNSDEDFIEVIKRFKIKKDFPLNINKELKKLNKINKKELLKRKDFRQQLVITIDGEDAKDFDDAIYLEKYDNYYKLYVHIADVSYYVKQDSFLDREAFKRGTSVYLVDRVVPMLPFELSNGLCSLNEGEDRLCLSAIIELSKNGKIKNYQFCESVINVKKRFNYKEVNEILSKPIEKVDKNLLDFYLMLKEMEKLSNILTKNRFKNGSIDFEIDEIEIKCDSLSNPVLITKRERLTSHRIIEEFMLKANKSAALFLGEKGHSIYRVHELPDKEKIENFFKFLNKLNYKIKINEKVQQLSLQKILNEVKGTKNARIINTLLLRSMKQAIYHVDNIGHFGLGFTDYTHFTSPIRRYPDLMIHRLIKYKLGVGEKIKKYDNKNFLAKIANRSSRRERIAMEAEREIIKIKSARFMSKFIGEVFDGIISGLTDFGFFVEILPYGIEGLIRNKDLNDVFIFDEDNYIMRGRKGKNYELGENIKVQILNVNIKRGFIDLKIV